MVWFEALSRLPRIGSYRASFASAASARNPIR
jgi:hypothetical protein